MGLGVIIPDLDVVEVSRIFERRVVPVEVAEPSVKLLFGCVFDTWRSGDELVDRWIPVTDGPDIAFVVTNISNVEPDLKLCINFN